MSTLGNELYIKYNEEDVVNLARILLDYFASRKVTYSYNIVAVSGDAIVVESLEEVGEFVDLDRLSCDVMGLTDPIGQLAKWLADKFKWLVDSISKVFSSLMQDFVNFVHSLIEGIYDYLTTIWNTIISTFNNLRTYLSSLFSSIVTVLQSLWNNIVNLFQSLESTLSSFFSNLLSQITSLGNSIVSYLTEFINNISNLFNSLKVTLLSTLNNLYNTIVSIPSIVSGSIKEFVSYISSVFGQLREFFSSLLARIEEGFEFVYKSVCNTIVSAFNNLRSFFVNIIDSISRFSQDIARFFNELWIGLTHLGQQISSIVLQIANNIRAGFTLIANALTGFVNAIMKFPEWFPKWFMDNIARPITGALESLAKWIWDNLPEFIKNVIIKINEFFESAWNFLTVTLPKLFEQLYSSLLDFISDPVGWLNKNVIRPLSYGITFIINVVKSELPVVINTVLNILGTIAKTILEVAKNIVSFLVNILIDVGNAFSSLLSILLTPIKNAISSAFRRLSQLLKDLASGKLKVSGEVEALDPFAMIILEEMFGPVALGSAIEMMSNVIPRARFRLQPLGVGVGVEIKLDEATKQSGKLLKEIGIELLKGYVVGLGMVFGEVLIEGVRHLVAQFLRNYVPIRFPTLDEGKKLVQRSMPTDHFNYILTKFVNWLGLEGYSDFVINLFIGNADWLKLTFMDRFGKSRTVPLGEIYEIPTISELCRMMMKDMFQRFDDFLKLMKARGVHENFAHLFYLLHFKYPSPEKLWEFTCRAIAGETWFRPPSDIVERAKKEAESVGAFTPKYTPADLANALKSPELALSVFSALTQYMKWQDYAMFSWLDNFTSDNWLVIDTLPEIPRKIDLRWMFKWGIFEAWSAWGIGLTNTIEEITKGYLNKSAEDVYKSIFDKLRSQTVEIDVRQYCRMLQADKVHPYWVPWIAVAEAMNALSEERTLVRTGFWNLYKEGLFNKDLLDVMFSGFFTVRFYVGYFDINSGKWVGTTGDKYIEIPVMFLPAEAKLIEVRCVMDRAVDIFRELQREILYCVREAILTPEEATNIIVGFVLDKGKITSTCRLLGISLPASFIPFSDWFSQEIRNITGREGAKLTVDNNWLNYLITIYNIASYSEQVRRARYWLSRIVSWILYRVVSGYVTKSDLENLLSIVKKYAKLTDYEIEGILAISDLAVAILRREYIPTPYQLATLAEYVPEVRKFIDIVLEKRGVPTEWREIWKKYIEIRPLINEVRRFLERVIMLFSYGALDLKTLDNILNKLRVYGYETQEIKYIEETAELYRVQRIFTQIIPTPLGLTTYFRYVPEALTLLELKLSKVLEPEIVKKYLPYLDIKKIVEFYKKLAINRSIYADLRGLINDLVRAYEYGVLKDSDLKRELEALKVYGLNDENIKLIMKRAQIRKMIRQARYSI